MPKGGARERSGRKPGLVQPIRVNIYVESARINLFKAKHGAAWQSQIRQLIERDLDYIQADDVDAAGTRYNIAVEERLQEDY